MRHDARQAAREGCCHAPERSEKHGNEQKMPMTSKLGRASRERERECTEVSQDRPAIGERQRRVGIEARALERSRKHGGQKDETCGRSHARKGSGYDAPALLALARTNDGTLYPLAKVGRRRRSRQGLEESFIGIASHTFYTYDIGFRCSIYFLLVMCYYNRYPDSRALRAAERLLQKGTICFVSSDFQ